jgi:hypothetical protein
MNKEGSRPMMTPTPPPISHQYCHRGRFNTAIGPSGIAVMRRSSSEKEKCLASMRRLRVKVAMHRFGAPGRTLCKLVEGVGRALARRMVVGKKTAKCRATRNTIRPHRPIVGWGEPTLRVTRTHLTRFPITDPEVFFWNQSSQTLLPNVSMHP